MSQAQPRGPNRPFTPANPHGDTPFNAAPDSMQCAPVLNTGMTLPQLIIYGASIYPVIAIVFISLLVRLHTVVGRGREDWYVERSTRARGDKYAERDGKADRSVSAGADGSQSGKEGRRGTLVIVLGSGGHTTEMFGILRNLGAGYITQRSARRVYVVSSGDAFSAARAGEFERDFMGAHAHSHTHSHEDAQPAKANGHAGTEKPKNGPTGGPASGSYEIVTVRRARDIHQSILTTPLTALHSLYDCVALLRASRTRTRPATLFTSGLTYPDLILTNGPGTGVCVVLASLLLRFFYLAPTVSHSIHSSRSKSKAGQQQESTKGCENAGEMRTVYIESWARVKSLSLSGRVLRFLVDRFCVQWKGLEGWAGKNREDDFGRRVEVVGGVSL